MDQNNDHIEFPFKTCFVITPYGTKTDPDKPDRSVNFEFVYDEIIAKTLAGVVPHHRSKDRTFSGVIHEDMFRQILTADVVICDITLLNPNVMYELGVRHAARPSGTIIIQQRENRQVPPFNLNLARVVKYSVPPPGEASESGEAKISRDNQIKATQDELRKYVRQSLRTRKMDSPVHALIPNLNLVVPAQSLETVAICVFPLNPDDSRRKQPVNTNAASEDGHENRDSPAKPDEPFSLQRELETQKTTPKKIAGPARRNDRRVQPGIGIATGNLRDVYDAADVWVNPENTRMEMGPIFGETISSYIRVLGSSGRGQTFEHDDIQTALQSAMRGLSTVLPGRAITTTAGALNRTHGVDRIVHVAAQEGFPLSGFSTVRRVGTCVECALEEVERLNRSFSRRVGFRPLLRRVLIPLFGTRNPGVDPIEVTKEIILAAKRHLDLETDSDLVRVLFLATTDQDLELCETAFRRLGYGVEAVHWEYQSRGELPGPA